MNEDIKDSEIKDSEKDVNGEAQSEKEEAPKKEKSRDIKKENAELAKKNAALEEKLKEAEDRYLRLAAEYENFRKRTQKEKEGIYADAYTDCITGILPIADNLERAVEFSDGEKVLEGVKLTLKSMKEAFEKMGITEIETEIFDPSVHNAVMHEENDELGEGVITQVFLKGYVKDGHVIRFAMVKTAN